MYIYNPHIVAFVNKQLPFKQQLIQFNTFLTQTKLDTITFGVAFRIFTENQFATPYTN